MQGTHNILILLFLSFSLALQAQQLEEAKTKKGVPEQRIHHEGYIVSYNSTWLEPNWVAWELTKEEAYGKVGRSGQFQPDPAVIGKSATTYDYSRSGYDRGHMAPAGDMKWSLEAMGESFYLSNICPQDNSLNAGLWEKLESRCRGWAKFHGKVWICCGPIVGKNPVTIGQSGVAVPSGFFKVVCIEHKGRYDGIGFIFPNGECTGTIWDYAFSIDEVEESTGHDFFYLLDDSVEGKMEANINLRFWQNN